MEKPIKVGNIDIAGLVLLSYEYIDSVTLLDDDFKSALKNIVYELNIPIEDIERSIVTQTSVMSGLAWAKARTRDLLGKLATDKKERKGAAFVEIRESMMRGGDNKPAITAINQMIDSDAKLAEIRNNYEMISTFDAFLSDLFRTAVCKENMIVQRSTREKLELRA